MRCKDAMVTMVFRCGEDEPAQKVARLMQEMRVGFLPVTNQAGHLVGVVTDRDLALRILAEGRSPETPIGSVMTLGNLLSCRPDDDLRDLERRMADDQKARAVVVENDKVVGVISAMDILIAEGSKRRAGKLMEAIAHRESRSALA